MRSWRDLKLASQAIYMFICLYVVWLLADSYFGHYCHHHVLRPLVIKKDILHYWIILKLFSHSIMSNSLWPHEQQASRSFTVFQSSLKFMSVESVIPSTHLILRHLLLFLPSIFLSIGVFSNELVLCICWPKCWSFSFNISPSNVYSGLISFRIDWFDLLSVQRTLRSLPQHHSSEASLFWHSAFFGCCSISLLFILTHQVSLFLDLMPFASWDGWGDVRGRLSSWWEWMEAWTVKINSWRSLVSQESTVSDAPDFWGWWVSN